MNFVMVCFVSNDFFNYIIKVKIEEYGMYYLLLWGKINIYCLNDVVMINY